MNVKYSKTVKKYLASCMKCINPANTAPVTRGAKQGVSKQFSFAFCGVSTNRRGLVESIFWQLNRFQTASSSVTWPSHTLFSLASKSSGSFLGALARPSWALLAPADRSAKGLWGGEPSGLTLPLRAPSWETSTVSPCASESAPRP